MRAIFLIVFFLAVSAIRFIISYPIEWIGIADSAWYCSSANSFFHSYQLKIAGQFNSFSLPLYSVLISPAYFFREMSDTFTAIKLINSLVMSSTMLPVFLLARRFMSFRRAFTVALLSVMIGPMFYTFTIMAESLHYPLMTWLVYLIYLSLIREDKRINLMLGLMFGLALLNKMSSLSLFICYNILIGISFATSSKFRFIRKFPINYLRGLVRYRHVLIALVITVFPYIVYREIAIGNSSASTVPYTYEWVRFFNNILEFNVIKYLEWFVVYLGELNLSTGLFLLPLSIFTIIHLCKSPQKEHKIFGLSVAILMLGVLALATLQSGYNFERLTERHFFVLTPLVLILSFMWLQGEKRRLPGLLRVAICFGIVVATCFALFMPSSTAGPAVDSAFIDSLKAVIQLTASHGISDNVVRVAILLTSLILIIWMSLIKATNRYRSIVVFLFLFMFSLTGTCYYLAIKQTRGLRNTRLPITNLIADSVSVSRQANLVFLCLPRFHVIDHIIWNKDNSNKIFYQARYHLENPSSFSFKHYIRLKRKIGVVNPTYFFSPFFAYCGANAIKSKCGIDIYETNDPESVKICGFHIDFGAPYSRQVLKKGWSGNEGSFVWAVGTQSEMDVYAESVKSGKTLIFKARPYPADQSVKVILNGKDIGTIVMQTGWHEYRLQIDAAYLKLGKNSVTFKFRHAKSPSESGGRDTRKLAVAFDWLKLEDAATLEWLKTIE